MKGASAIALLAVGMLIGSFIMSVRPLPPVTVRVEAPLQPPPAPVAEPVKAAPAEEPSLTTEPPPAIIAEAAARQPVVPKKEPFIAPAPAPLPPIELKTPIVEKIEADAAEDPENPKSLTLNGRVTPNIDVDVKCKVSGQILRLPVEVGDVVEKGQVLAEIDNSDEERGVLRAQLAVKSAQTRLDQCRQALEIGEQSLLISKARVDAALRSQEVKAKRTADRVTRLKDPVKKQYISQEEFDDAQAEAVIAQALLDSTRAQHDDLKTQSMALALKRHDIQLAEAQLEMDRLTLRNTQQRVTDTQVFAPIKGIVTSRYVQAGSVIISGTSTQGTRILTISDVSSMFVNVPVEACHIGRMKEGMAAQVQCESFPDETLHGKIARIAPRGVLMQNKVMFEVRVEIEDAKKTLLKPEMPAKVTFDLSKS